MDILKELNPLATESAESVIELSDHEEVFMTQLAKRIAAAIFATPLSEQIHFFATAIVAFAIAAACVASIIIVPIVVIMTELAR